MAIVCLSFFNFDSGSYIIFAPGRTGLWLCRRRTSTRNSPSSSLAWFQASIIELKRHSITERLLHALTAWLLTYPVFVRWCRGCILECYRWSDAQQVTWFQLGNCRSLHFTFIGVGSQAAKNWQAHIICKHDNSFTIYIQTCTAMLAWVLDVWLTIHEPSPPRWLWARTCGISSCLS